MVCNLKISPSISVYLIEIYVFSLNTSSLVYIVPEYFRENNSDKKQRNNTEAIIENNSFITQKSSITGMISPTA